MVCKRSACLLGSRSSELSLSLSSEKRSSVIGHNFFSLVLKRFVTDARTACVPAGAQESRYLGFGVLRGRAREKRFYNVLTVKIWPLLFELPSAKKPEQQNTEKKSTKQQHLSFRRRRDTSLRLLTPSYLYHTLIYYPEIGAETLPLVSLFELDQ